MWCREYTGAQHDVVRHQPVVKLLLRVVERGLPLPPPALRQLLQPAAELDVVVQAKVAGVGAYVGQQVLALGVQGFGPQVCRVWVPSRQGGGGGGGTWSRFSSKYHTYSSVALFVLQIR